MGLFRVVLQACVPRSRVVIVGRWGGAGVGGWPGGGWAGGGGGGCRGGRGGGGGGGSGRWRVVPRPVASRSPRRPARPCSGTAVGGWARWCPQRPPRIPATYARSRGR